MKNDTQDVHPRPRCTPLLSTALLALLQATACGPLDDGGAPAEAPALESRSAPLAVDNGLAFNGLAFNGLAFNGLSSAEFRAWFEQDPALHANQMQYVVQCAVPQGQQRTYTHPATQTTYTWNGLLGLTPDWANGKPATELEQQLVSACLAAHGNKYGAHVAISVLGRDAKNKEIPLTPNELTLYPKREACFFGNLFKGEGLYVGNDGTTLTHAQSAPRMCALLGENQTVRDTCEPLVFVDSCAAHCTPDPSGRFYVKCTYNGKQYRPLVTRMRAQDIYSCGDQVCQITEKCGTGGSYDSCKADCGTCG